MKPSISNLLQQAKNLLLFACLAIGMLFLAHKALLLSLVIYLYLSTFTYIYIYFKRDQDKRTHIYFFVAFMLLVIIAYALIYMHLGIVDTGEIESQLSNWDYYYFSVVTWTTLGYGDFKPSPESRLYAASEAFLGYIYMAFFVAKFFDWMNKRDIND